MKNLIKNDNALANNDGQVTKKLSSRKLQSLSFAIIFSLKDNFHSSLIHNRMDVNSVSSKLVGLMVRDLYGLMKQVVIEMSDPEFLGKGQIVYKGEILLDNNTDGNVPTDTSSHCQELIGFAESLANAALMYSVGDDALQACLKKGVGQLPVIKLTSSFQNKAAILSDNGNVLIGDSHYEKLCSEAHKFLKLIEVLNIGGYKVEINTGKKLITIPDLKFGTTKFNWHAYAERKINCLFTGYFKSRHEAEYLINDKVYVLSVPITEFELYKERCKKMEWASLKLELSKPGNPFHAAQTKYTLIETINYFESPPKLVDSQLELLESES